MDTSKKVGYLGYTHATTNKPSNAKLVASILLTQFGGEKDGSVDVECRCERLGYPPQTLPADLPAKWMWISRSGAHIECHKRSPRSPSVGGMCRLTMWSLHPATFWHQSRATASCFCTSIGLLTQLQMGLAIYQWDVSLGRRRADYNLCQVKAQFENKMKTTVM